MRSTRESDISYSTRYLNAAYYNGLFTLVCSRALDEAAGCKAAGGSAEMTTHSWYRVQTQDTDTRWECVMGTKTCP